MTYQQALDYLYSSLPMFQRIGDKAFNKDLTNTLTLCKALGNPHEQFKSVHIAGTNGKGTSAHTIAAILQQAGYTTGLYTSPHLKSFAERIRINGVEIPQDHVVRFVENNYELLESLQPSFFETTVVMAFEYFSLEQVDIAIVEVGMGGRFDSTNVITPVISLITHIGYDHQQFLGDTLEKIAGEKAGIIKPNVPAVIGADQPELLPVYERRAREVNAPLKATSLSVRKELAETDQERVFSVMCDDQEVYTNLHTSLAGDYYLKNIPGILECIHQLRLKGFEVSDHHLRDGLLKVQELTGLKGRWQTLSENPPTICDVGHNKDGIKAILQQLNTTNFNKLHFVFGTVRDKALDDILALLPTQAMYYFCQADIPRALPADELKSLAFNYNLHGDSYSNVNLAIESAQKAASAEDLIFIGGSTFIVAEINGL